MCGVNRRPVIRQLATQNILYRDLSVKGAPLSCVNSRECRGDSSARQVPRKASSSG